MSVSTIRMPAWWYSIRVKLALSISIPIALISMFVFWFFPARLERQALIAQADKANAVAVMMAYNLTPALVADNHPAVCDVVISARQNADIDYVMVLDDSGQVIATFDSMRANEINYADVAFAEKISRDGMTYQTVAPIISRSALLGRVYVGLSLDGLRSTIADARRTIAGVSLGICFGGMLLVTVLSTIMTKPLVRMVKTAERIAGGDWRQRTRIRTRDEVGQLAGAFDSMVDTIEQAYQDMRRSEKSYRDLFTSNPFPMWVIDLETQAILDVNDAALEGYGYAREEFAAMTIHDIIMDGPFAEMDDLRSRHGIVNRSAGWRHLKRDGSIIEVELSSHPLPLSSGRKARLVLANDVTARVRAEGMLRDSEERNRTLSEATFEGITLTEDGVIIDTNLQFAKMLGYERVHLIGMPVMELVHPDDREHVRKRKQLDRSEAYEHKFVRRDGATMYVEVRARRYTYQAQTVRMAAYRDITERKVAEEALLFEKARFEQLFENAPIGIVLCDRSERVVHANRVFGNMFGYAMEELHGRVLNEIVLPAEFAEEGIAYSNCVLAGSSVHGEVTRRRKDGSLIDVDMYGVPIIVNGGSAGLFGIYVDITARKKAESKLRLLAHTVESTKDCISITDLQDRIIFVNEAFESVYGYSKDEVMGKNIAVFRSPRTPCTITREILPTTLAGGWYGEIFNRRKDGGDFPIELWTSVVRNDTGEPVATVGVARDVTERMKTEQKRIQLVKELEDINKELNDFAYIVSHDLKAPLRAIGSLVDWLSTDYGHKLGDEGKEMLNVLLGRTKRMHDLIEGVLKYSRIGRAKEQPAPVDLDTLVPGIVDLLSPPRNTAVHVLHPLPVVLGEQTRLQQVFQNLLSNAIKFIDKPEGLIEVGCERENGHWKFHVSDNGPGIEQKHYEKIFQIFQTLSARDQFESTGIGLTIVKKIIETYGGSIWLESQVGTGTTFYFTLPVHAN